MTLSYPSTLHGFFRSGAAWRVRIALNLKLLPVEKVAYHLRRGEQKSGDYLRLNPQGLVPALELEDGTVLTQSLAIIEWLDENWPDPPLLPADSLARARVRAFALAIACDIHPIQNLGVLMKLRGLGHTEAEANAWARDIITDGLTACEKLAPAHSGAFLFGDTPSLADICLVPQIANARRFGVDLAGLPRLLAVEAACAALPAFADAEPSKQPDAE
jgi:maleylpyruvate isomerase